MINQANEADNNDTCICKKNLAQRRKKKEEVERNILKRLVKKVGRREREKKEKSKKERKEIMMMKKSELNWCICIIVLATSGLCAARSGLYSEESPSSVRIEQCHEGCIKKVTKYKSEADFKKKRNKQI